VAPVTKRTTKVGTEYWEVAVKKTENGRTARKTKNLPCDRYTKKDAERLAARLQVEIEDNFHARLDNRKGKGATLADLVIEYEAQFKPTGKWSKTKANDIKRLKTHDIAAKSLNALTIPAWVAHARKRRKTVQPATVNQDFIWFKQILETAEDMGHPVDTNALARATRLLKKERVIAASKHRDVRPTRDELERILCHFDARNSRAQIPMTEIALFALFSSRREAEICRIEWRDYNKDEGTLLVRDGKSARGSQGNHIRTALSPRAAAIIDRQPRDLKEPRIFPYNYNSVANSMYQATKALDLEHLTFHTLRHEAASHHAELGYDIPRLALITGHKTWKHLQRYSHLQGLKTKDKYAGWERISDLPAPRVDTGEVVELSPGLIRGVE